MGPISSRSLLLEQRRTHHSPPPGADIPTRVTPGAEVVTANAPPLLGQLFPDFIHELEQLLRAKGRYDLADQLPTLAVHARCRCRQNDCATFYTAPPPKGAYGRGHHSIQLPSTSGMIIADAIVDRLVGVEVLDRPDVKAALDAWPNIPEKPAAD